MTPRDNLLSLYRRKGFEFAPSYLDLCPYLMDQFQRVAAEKGRPGATLAEYFGRDSLPIVPAPEPEPAPRPGLDWHKFYPGGLKPGTKFTEEWGIANEPGSAAAMHMTRMRHPLLEMDSLEQVISYPWPDWSKADAGTISGFVASEKAGGSLVLGWMPMTVWEIAWYLRGMEKIFEDMCDENHIGEFIFDKVTELGCQRAAYFARAGVDVLAIGDDIGMQSRILMSVEMWREWLQPRLAKIIRAAKDVNPDILIDYHSCGYIVPFLDGIVDSGVDILNPVQPECMDFKEIHDAYCDRLSFRGTLGTQTTMPYGTPEEVRETVWRNLDIAGDKGGLLCCPTHLLEPEVPWANIEAYVKACRDYRA